MTDSPASTLSPARLPYAGFGWRAAASVVADHLPPKLVGVDKKASIWSFAERLPMDWYWGMLETRLAADDGRVDLLGALVQNAETREQLAETLRDGEVSALRSSRSTLQAWTRHDDSLFARSPNFWFEWDQDRPDAAALNWLCLAPEFFDKSVSRLSGDEVLRLADEFLSSERSLAVDGAREVLHRAQASLPEGGRLMSFSSLRPRGKNACRVFARLPRGQLKPWLESLDWPGDSGALDEVLPLFDVEGEQQWCQIEFSETLGPYLALELAQTERGFPNRQARQRLLDYAVEKGWACPEKARATMDWHGTSPATLPPHPEVKLMKSFHLKLALSPERSPEAKAYLGFYFRKPKAARAA